MPTNGCANFFLCKDSESKKIADKLIGSTVVDSRHHPLITQNGLNEIEKQNGQIRPAALASSKYLC